MKRQIIKIDEELCTGCGLCASTCHEGAIGMVNGKAKLLKADHCDGLGNCLPGCPVGAISFEEREFDTELNSTENAEQSKTETKTAKAPLEPLACGCPGTNTKTFDRKISIPSATQSVSMQEPNFSQGAIFSQEPNFSMESKLKQWPVQIKLVPPNAPYFQNANLLIAADCTAFAYGNFHNEFMKNKITLIGCPKLDAGDYSEKLTAILKANNIKSVTVVRMEVPCCKGMADAAIKALQNCGKMIPWQIVTISTDGRILEQ